MLPKLHRKKGGKNRRVLNIVSIVSGILFSCLVLFLALDSFTLYWFTLLNKDSALEARRNEDFEWYDSFADGATGGRPAGKPAPGYNYNFTGISEPFDVMKLVESSLSEEDKMKNSTALRFYIFAHDNAGYNKYAIIGAMSALDPETKWLHNPDGKWGSYTYQNIQTGDEPGPDGETYSYLLDNAAWKTWVDNIVANGAHHGGAHQVGLGIVQWTDKPNLKRATGLLNYATSKGMPWQSPAVQASWFIDEPGMTDTYKWFGSDDPKDKALTVTATEWATRYAIGYIGNNSNPSGRTAKVPEAEAFYNQYSGKDPWFYNPDGSQIYAPSGNNGSLSAGGYIWGENACPACGKVKSSDWHCPYCGPTYDNSTPQGLLLARVALLNLIGYRTNGWVFPSGGALGFTSAAKADARCDNYRITIANFGRTSGHAADCCSAVQAMVRLSGVDVNMPTYGTLQMESYLYDKGEDVYNNGTYHCAKNNGAWEYVGLAGSVQLQPGDILIYNTDYPNAGGSGHIQMYVGANVAQERWPETNSVLAQASQEQYYWDLSAKSNIDGRYRVFRSTAQCPYNNLANWNTWKSEYYNNFGRNYPS